MSGPWQLLPDAALKLTPQYQAYHNRVVEACVKLMGEHVRLFFSEQCDYLQEFLENEDPEDVAYTQWEHLD